MDRGYTVTGYMNLIGQRFGRLTVIDHGGWRTQPSGQKKRLWLCKCECGKTTIVTHSNLRSATGTRSCGCIWEEMSSAGSFHLAHGCSRVHSWTPEYAAWAGMMQRCTNPKAKTYRHYGGRGITVCERWLNFENFLHDVGPKPSPVHSLGRVDNSNGYSPDNCRWETPVQQGRNKRNNVLITAFGKTTTLSGWEEITGVRRGTISVRLGLGWNPEEAVSRKPHYGNKTRRHDPFGLPSG